VCMALLLPTCLTMCTAVCTSMWALGSAPAEQPGELLCRQLCVAELHAAALLPALRCCGARGGNASVPPVLMGSALGCVDTRPYGQEGCAGRGGAELSPTAQCWHCSEMLNCHSATSHIPEKLLL